jgi:hypothetical protein
MRAGTAVCVSPSRVWPNSEQGGRYNGHGDWPSVTAPQAKPGQQCLAVKSYLILRQLKVLMAWATGHAAGQGVYYVARHA